MHKLRPTLWRTCRIIAGETRLQFLWNLFDHGELCVIEMARMTTSSAHNATTQLRALNARGLITFRREKMRVIYRAEANQLVDNSPELLAALRTCHEQSVSFETVIRMATAFTHERRIEIIRALDISKQTLCGLLDSTNMNSSPLSRHLRKLQDRGFVRQVNGVYRIATPGNPLGRTLLKIVRG